MSNTRELLNKLSELISSGALTKAKCVDAETFICVTEKNAQGMTYHQTPFDVLPEQFRQLFLHHKAGDVIGHFKIVAVFDVWPDAIPVPQTNKPVAY
jgi:hypothetical protein